MFIKQVPRLLVLFTAVLLTLRGMSPDNVLLAQSDATCNTFIAKGFNNTTSNCGSVDPNSLCYGAESLGAGFLAGTTTSFDSPGDIVELSPLASVVSSPLDIEADSLGIAVIHSRANLHTAFNGDLVIVEIGNAELENGVLPSEAMPIPEPILVTTAAQTNLFTEPAAGAEAVGRVSSGVSLEADGFSPDGQWLRVLYRHDNHVNAWINVSALTTGLDLGGLPVIHESTRTPMQRFYVNTLNAEEANCGSVLPPTLLIQSPLDTETVFYTNGFEIHLDGTLFFQSYNPNSFCLLDGEATFVIPDPAEFFGPDFAGFNAPGGPSDDEILEMIIEAGDAFQTPRQGPFSLGSDERENDYVLPENFTMGQIDVQSCADLYPDTNFELLATLSPSLNYALDVDLLRALNEDAGTTTAARPVQVVRPAAPPAIQPVPRPVPVPPSRPPAQPSDDDDDDDDDDDEICVDVSPGDRTVCFTVSD